MTYERTESPWVYRCEDGDHHVSVQIIEESPEEGESDWVVDGWRESFPSLYEARAYRYGLERASEYMHDYTLEFVDLTEGQDGT